MLKSSLDIARFIKDQNKSSRIDLMSSSTKLEKKTEKDKSVEDHKNVDMKHFLDSVEKISREKEEETGNSRLQMFELENLLKSHLISDDIKADGVFFARRISKADDQSVTEEDSSTSPPPPHLQLIMNTSGRGIVITKFWIGSNVDQITLTPQT